MTRTSQQAAEANLARARQAIQLVKAITYTPNEATGDAALLLRQTLQHLEDITNDCIQGLCPFTSRLAGGNLLGDRSGL